jgi:hypothetical protein
MNRDEILRMTEGEMGIQEPKRMTFSTGEVWWSSILSGISTPFLRDKKIRHVINLGVPLHSSLRDELKRGSDLKSYTYYPVKDDENQNILPAVMGTWWIVQHAHERGESVLVHCFAGRNRSGAAMAKIVCEEYMRVKKIPRKDAMTAAIAYLKIITKGMALTNTEFIRQLQDNS